MSTSWVRIKLKFLQIIPVMILKWHPHPGLCLMPWLHLHVTPSHESPKGQIIYTGCPPKRGMLDFRYFDINKYSIFLFHQIKHCFLKRMIIEIGWVVLILWSFLKNSHCQFFLHSRDISVRDNGFSDFHTLLPESPLIRANKTKRELMDCYTCRK